MSYLEPRLRSAKRLSCWANQRSLNVTIFPCNNGVWCESRTSKPVREMGLRSLPQIFDVDDVQAKARAKEMTVLDWSTKISELNFLENFLAIIKARQIVGNSMTNYIKMTNNWIATMRFAYFLGRWALCGSDYFPKNYQSWAKITTNKIIQKKLSSSKETGRNYRFYKILKLRPTIQK